MAKNYDKLLAVAHGCHTSFHNNMCAPVDLFKVHDSHNGCVYLVPNHARNIYYFSGGTMTFISDYLNRHGVNWIVVSLDGSVLIKLLNE